MDRRETRILNKELAKLSDGKTSLTDFLAQASNLHWLISQALEGIYCGEDGKVHERLGETRFYITFGWHQIADGYPPRIEYAYIS